MGLRQRSLEEMVSSLDWRDRSVFVTGHTGFKGSWLTLWLHRLGARVHGYAKEPPTPINLFEVSRIGSLLESEIRADLADLKALRGAIAKARPEIIFHLAAQPLVRESYRDPLGTFNTNVMGTANLLEAARESDCVQAIVLVTTDKVYENRDWPYPYREIDGLGGYDPYSASKAAMEIVVASYRKSFFNRETPRPVHMATARAGNVIGGGDWATDRLVPDCFRAFANGQALLLRYPDAIRPWQHVLEPLAGYLKLAERLCSEKGAGFSVPWNFGPDTDGDATVGQVAEKLAELWGDGPTVTRAASIANPHEAGLLRLDSSRARAELGWKPRWSLSDALLRTVSWQRAWKSGEDMQQFSLSQIQDYEAIRG